MGLYRMNTAPPRPTLGLLDTSDGPSGLSRYLELLWPVLTNEFRVVVFGDPRGPYTDFSSSEFVPLPQKQRNRHSNDLHAQKRNDDPSSFHVRLALRSAYLKFAPALARASVGFARDAFAIARVLRPHRLNVLYMPLSDLDHTPFAAWIAGVPGRVGVFHLPPSGSASRGTRQVTRTMMKSLTASIAVSNQIGAAWGALSPAARKRMSIIANGITIPDLKTNSESRESVLARHGLSNDGRALWLAAGRLTTQKGFAYLVDSISSLKDRYPELVVAIAGEGPLHGELSAQIHRLGLTHHVKLLGQVKGLEALMQVADGFVLSSISEAMPFVLLEAMSHGLPVVATAVGGVPELVQDGKNGVLCRPGSSDQLASGIELIVSQPETARAMGEAARDTVRRCYSVDAMRASTLEVFRGAADGIRSKPLALGVAPGC